MNKRAETYLPLFLNVGMPNLIIIINNEIICFNEIMGSPDYYENDPFDVDTDGDGFNDGIEVNIHGTDPTDPTDYPYSGGGAGGFG